MYKAYKQSLARGGKYKVEAMLFAKDETYSLQQLRQSLIDETYNLDEYIEFMVYEPKKRVINAPHYKDKIVQLSINNILKEVYNKCFIFDSYACIDKKGTHKCVERISHFMRKAKWEYGNEAYIIKMDIKKFFYSIDRDVLKKIYAKKIKCEKSLRLIYRIIDSSAMIDELGLPLGNTLSQISANVYMNEADQYAKRKLGLKYYVRYADDIVIIVKNKETAIKVLTKLTKVLEDQLNLALNKNKTKIFPISQGVNTVGFKIHTTHRMLRNESKKKVKRKTKKFPKLLANQEITKEKVEQIINSWYGHAKYADSHNFINSLMSKNNYIYQNSKGALKIDEARG